MYLLSYLYWCPFVYRVGDSIYKKINHKEDGSKLGLEIVKDHKDYG